MRADGRRAASGVGPAAAAGLLLALGGAYLARALAYGVGTLADPGIGFFPAIVASVWVLAAASLLARPRVEKKASEQAEAAWSAPGLLRRVNFVAAGGVGFIVLSPLIGFGPPAMLLAVLCLWGSGEQRTARLAAVAVMAAILCYGVLAGLMGLPLSSLI